MPKKETKKNGKENIHQAQQASPKQKALDAKRKPRKFPKQKLFIGVAFIVLILTAFGIWQYNEGQKP